MRAFIVPCGIGTVVIPSYVAPAGTDSIWIEWLHCPFASSVHSTPTGIVPLSACPVFEMLKYISTVPCPDDRYPTTSV